MTRKRSDNELLADAFASKEYRAELAHARADQAEQAKRSPLASLEFEKSDVMAEAGSENAKDH